MQPNLNRSPWQKLKAWFKPFQKRYNDLVFTPLALVLFYKGPDWYNAWRGYPEMHGFSVDTLNAFWWALVAVCGANLVSYALFWANHSDLFNEFIDCNEQDLLRKEVSNDPAQLAAPDSHFITQFHYRKSWRIYNASQAILSRYYWGFLALSCIAAWAVPQGQ